MAILWVGAEDCDYDAKPSVTWNTTPNRSGYDRGRFSTTGSSTSDPNTVRLVGARWAAASSDLWFSMRINCSGNASGQWITFYDPSGVRRLILHASGASTLLNTRTSSGTIATIATFAWAPTKSSLRKIDVHVVYGTSGSVTIYEEGTQVATYSGNVTTESATQLQSCDIGGVYTSGVAYFSEIIVADQDTRAMSVVTLTSSTAGAAQQWTGTATNVNQNSLTNDVNFIYSGTNDQIQQYKPGSLPSGSFSVKAVVHSARALIGAAGPQHLAFVTRVGSTDYDSSNYTPTTTFGPVQHVQSVNPSTSSAWAVADLASTNLQYGVKSKA